MGMIWGLESVSLLLGLLLFYVEVFKLRFKNFIPSMFLLLYVPLFCISPFLYHILIGGALTIDRKVQGLIFTDARIYFIYHLYNIFLLLSFLVVSKLFNSYNEHKQIVFIKTNLQQRIIFFLLLILGLYLYVSSTGLSVFELLVADRFIWFESANYSSFYSVVASYFISLTPLFFYFYVKEKKYFFIFITFILLLIYGILSKDRKWIIFMISGAVAAKYLLSGNRLVFKPKIVIGSLFFGLILVFWQIFRDVLFTELVTGRGNFLDHAKDMGEKLLLQGDFPYYYFSSMTAIKMNFIDGFEIPLGIVRRQLFFFVPVDYSFGLKIKDISAIFSDALDAGDQLRGGNMPPGLIGLFVLSFNWWLGLLPFTMIPLVLFYVNNISWAYTSSFQPVFYSNCFSFMILLLRGDDSSAFYFFIFNFGIFFFIKNIVAKRKVTFSQRIASAQILQDKMEQRSVGFIESDKLGFPCSTQTDS